MVPEPSSVIAGAFGRIEDQGGTRTETEALGSVLLNQAKNRHLPSIARCVLVAQIPRAQVAGIAKELVALVRSARDAAVVVACNEKLCEGIGRPWHLPPIHMPCDRRSLVLNWSRLLGIP
jgi:hypothetical protein